MSGTLPRDNSDMEVAHRIVEVRAATTSSMFVRKGQMRNLVPFTHIINVDEVVAQWNRKYDNNVTKV